MSTAEAVLIVEKPGAAMEDWAVDRVREDVAAEATEVRLLRSGPDHAGPRDWVHQGLDDLEGLESALAGLTTLRVLLWGFEPRDRLDVSWVTALASRYVGEIERLVPRSSDRGVPPRLCRVPHRPLDDVRSQRLTVFPGPILPLHMGSHQRAFQTLIGLNEAGLYTDALITGHAKMRLRAEPLLRQVCPRVWHYRNKPRKLPKHLSARRTVEQRWRSMHGQSGDGPLLFEERLVNKAPYSGQKAVRRLVDSGQYHTVILNYAWLDRIRELVPPSVRERIRWVCDTHDVQFVRGATANAGEHRVLVSEDRERELELSILRSFDLVLAISQSDYDVLCKHLDPSKVLLVPTGFDYALAAPPRPRPGAPRFGFIGSRMDANVKALGVIMQKWWPAVIGRWPEAQLAIAGSICDDPEARDLTFLERNVRALGFVESLKDFYANVDIVLNPVVVHGGLNFKSVEAVMAGKLLVTTPLGRKCLGNPDLATTVDSGEELVRAVQEELEDGEAFAARRREAQEAARAVFGDRTANAPLVEALRADEPRASGDEPVQIATVRPRRILIQCGDHWENRCRILSVARALSERGHAPTVLVYRPEMATSFLAEGVDAVALYDYSENRVQREARRIRCRTIKKLATPYRGFDLDDVAAVDQIQKPKAYSDEKLPKAIDKVTQHVDRLLRVLRSVEPDQVFVWNGHTGYVANVLRQYARNTGTPAAFMERSVFRDGLFVDPQGVNGYSSLSERTMAEIRRDPVVAEPAVRPVSEAIAPVDAAEVEALDELGPWQGRPVVFAPLQVQSDTNIVLHSPDVQTMRDFVEVAEARYRGPDDAVVVRPHPEEVEQNLKLPALPECYLDARGGLDAWLERADHVVTINSTVGLEALLRGKKVTALGRGIYTGKGLTGEHGPPAREDVEAFFRYLVGRHTSLPEQEAGVLEEIAPRATHGAPPPACNPWGVDPSAMAARWKRTREELRREAEQVGAIFLHVHIGPGDALDLTYRKLRETVTPEWLEGRAREVLELPAEVEVRYGRSAPSGADAKLPRVHVSNRPMGERSVDRYFCPHVAPSP